MSSTVPMGEPGYACPKCEYARMRTDTAPAWQCPACKVVYAKALRAQSGVPKVADALIGGAEPVAPPRQPHPLTAAAPEFGAALVFLFAFVAPHAFRNMDLVYSATPIIFLEFFAVHAGMFTLFVRQRAGPDARAGVAIALGVGYGLFCLVWGFVFRALWPAMVITVVILGRFFNAARSDVEQLGGGVPVQFIVNVMLFFLVMTVGQALPMPDLDSARGVLEAVREKERLRGVSSTFDPLRSVWVLVLWYTLQGVLAWWRAASTAQAARAGAGGLQIDTYPGYLEVLHVHPNYYRLVCFVVGAVGIGIPASVLLGGSREMPGFVGLIMVVVALTGALFLYGGVKQSWTRRWVMHVMPGRISASDEGREMALTEELTQVDEIVAQPSAGRLANWKVVAKRGAQALEVDHGLDRGTAGALARLMILFYKFGDQPEALRVAIQREPEVQALLEEHELRQLKVQRADPA